MKRSLRSRLETALDGELTARVDPYLVRQLVWNQVDNAVEHTDPGRKLKEPSSTSHAAFIFPPTYWFPG